MRITHDRSDRVALQVMEDGICRITVSRRYAGDPPVPDGRLVLEVIWQPNGIVPTGRNTAPIPVSAIPALRAALETLGTTQPLRDLLLDDARAEERKGE